MAEVAIPLMALGSLYIMQNQKNKQESKCGETFTNMGKRQVPALPNTNTPPVNYPVPTNKSLASNPRRYPSGQAATDKYFQEQVYKNKMAQSANVKEFQSLSGNKLSTKDLKHNNMVPFFGSKVTQRTVGLNGNESILDSYSGSASQIIHKREQAPLFKPQKNMTYANGAPSYTDFLQSRVNPSMRMANVKPWEEVRVGPGLNKGYTSSGSDGFNAGMEARKDWEPKTIDQLRTKNNPKMVYNGVVLGASAGRGRGARGIEGKVEKNRPDTFYLNTPDRWFTTGGQEKAQTAQPEQVLRAENRPGTTREYFGGGGASKEHTGTYQDGQYNYPRRPQLEPNTKYLGGANDPGAWSIQKNEGDISDYGRGGVQMLPNSRTLTSERTEMGPVSRGIWAAVTPVLDALRPSRKENVVGTIRPTGNAHTTVSKNQVYNPAERTKTTIREQTENTKYTLQGGYNHGGGYATNAQQPVDNQRDTTSCEYIGNSSAPAWATGPREYGADYNAFLNPDREQLSKVDRMNQGYEPLFNGTQNITTWKSSGTGTAAAEGPGNFPKRPGNTETFGAISGKHTRERAIDCQRMNGNILAAFKSNPYAQSLHSAV